MSYVAVWEGHGFRRAGGPRTPRAQPLTDMLTSDQFYIAHRCGGANYPEMSAQGINAAVVRGYRAIEISVYKCETGEYVCTHDWNTAGATGQNIPIHENDWDTLKEIPTLVPTEAPAPEAIPGRLLRFTDVIDLVPASMVIFLDHKDTSMGQTVTPERQAEIDELLGYVSTIPGYEERFVWKVFKEGWATAEYARSEYGLKSWGIYYGDEITTAPSRLSSFDIVGVEWRDTQTEFDAALGTNKPVVAHVVINAGQRNAAQTKGADGYMNSNILAMP